MTRLISIIEKDIHGILGLALQAQGTLKDVGVERRLTGADSEPFLSCAAVLHGQQRTWHNQWPCIGNFG